jgi:hypothetical protein
VKALDEERVTVSFWNNPARYRLKLERSSLWRKVRG